MARTTRKPHQAQPGPGGDLASYHVLFAANPLPMWIYDLETLAFLEVNDAAVATYGYSRDEFLGMRITEIRPVEDVPALLADVAQDRPALQQASSWRHRLKSGDLIDVEISSHTLRFADRPAALVVAQNVTDRLRAERSLTESEARKAGMLAAALDAVVAVDAAGLITEFNPAAERMFGRPRDEVLGRSLAETIVPPELRTQYRRAFRRVVAGRSSMLGRRAELRGMHADGSTFPVEFTVYRVVMPGPPAFSGFIRDLSESRRLEEQLLQSQKMESIGRLAGGIAHDFNNMLTAINGYSQLALDAADLPTQVRDDLLQIRAAARRATELTGQLLAFSRRQVLRPIPLDLTKTFAEISPMLHRLLGEDVELFVRTEPGLGHVLADPGQLTQVIMNLALNARDAMPAGGQLELAAANVELGTEYASGHAEVVPGTFVVLSVSDTGVGMDVATRARLFEPFFTTKPPGKGTGLGLATAYGIVRQSGGHIWVYSEPGEGTVFKVYLPRVERATGERVQLPPRARATDGTETILVVEDDEAVRGFVDAVLTKRGYRVLQTANAAEALDAIRDSAGRIELLLTDIVMPGTSGADLATRVRSIAPSIRILFVSGYTEDTIVHRGVLDAGVSFLAKPFSPEELAERVRRELDA